MARQLVDDMSASDAIDPRWGFREMVPVLVVVLFVCVGVGLMYVLGDSRRDAR